MFHKISKPILERMEYLEEIDKSDRLDGTLRMKRLRQIQPDTGKFIALLAATAPKGNFIEIGTSAGYSTLWLSLACIERKTQITTFEILEEKQALAEETFRLTNLNNVVKLVKGDALQYLKNYSDISFCFLDAEKEIYEECYDLLVPRMKKGGLLVADNAINHIKTLRPMIDKCSNDVRVDALVIPVGKGELICRKK
jgi:predicted O-methyltransferase YrrM